MTGRFHSATGKYVHLVDNHGNHGRALCGVGGIWYQAPPAGTMGSLPDCPDCKGREMANDPEFLRTLDQALRYRGQVLVEVNPETRWERPEMVIDRTPTNGYALAGSSIHSVLHDKHAYVSDVNAEHRWRRFYDVFPTLTAAARALGL